MATRLIALVSRFHPDGFVSVHALEDYVAFIYSAVYTAFLGVQDIDPMVLTSLHGDRSIEGGASRVPAQNCQWVTAEPYDALGVS